MSLEKKPLDNNRLKWVLDITIGYEKAKPLDLTDIVTGRSPPCTTHLHYRLYPSSEVSTRFKAITFELHYIIFNI